jgi:hypothetical protein
MDIFSLGRFRSNFWGDVPNAKDRREKIQNELAKARAEYDKRLAVGSIVLQDYKTPLVFSVNGNIVCEKAFVNILGIADRLGNKSKTWIDEVDIFLGKCLLPFI